MAWDIGAIEYGASQTPVIVPTTPPSTTPSPQPGDPGLDPVAPHDIAPIPIRQGGGAVFILARLFLDTGTEYEAKRTIVHPNYVYEGRVKQYGYVDRSIPVPSGLPQLGDCRIQIVDTDRKFRELMAHNTPRRRFIDLRMVREGESESANAPFATFEIYNCEFTAGLVDVFGRDINFAWIDRQIPGLINRTNFPDLMEGIDEAFMPIIGGILDAPDLASPLSPSPQGVLTLPRMTLRRWGLAQHQIAYVELCGRVNSEDMFALISPTEYVITEEPHTIDGVDYTLSFIDFNADRVAGQEVRCRIVEGFWYRGDFGGLPAVENSPLSGLRNPIDFLINVIYGVLKTETRIPRFNTASFQTVRDLMNQGIITSVSPHQGYTCDGAIVEPITVREFLGQWVTSFEVDLFVNRFGEIAVNLTLESDPNRPVFSDGPIFGAATDNSLISINSVRQRLADPTCNRLFYNFARNYSTGELAGKDKFENEADQVALAGPNSPPVPQIESDVVEFRFVRDPIVAEDVARRRMEFLALGSYRIELEMPLPEVFNDLELAKLIGITHYGGLEVGGFHNAEFKTTGLTYDLDRMAATVRGILREPLRDSCSGITARIPLGGSQGHVITNDDVVDTDYYVFEVPLDVADYPGLTAAWWGLLADSSGGTVSEGYTVDLVDETGAVYDSIVIANGMPKTTLPLRAFTPVGSHKYTIRMRATPGTTFDLFINRFEVFVDVVDSTRVVLRVPLMNTSGSIAGGYNDPDVNNIVATIDRILNRAAYGPTVEFYVPTWLLELTKNTGTSVVYQQNVRAAMEWAGFAHVTGYTALKNQTSGNIATDSEIAVTTDVPTLQTKTLTPGSNEFIGTDEFRVNFKFTPDPLAPVNGQYLGIYKNELVIEIDCPSKVQLLHPIGSDCNTEVSGPDQFEQPHFRGIDSTKYEPGTQWFFEGSANDTAGTGSYTLIDGGASLTGTSGTDVIALTGFSTTVVQRKRTAALSLTDGHTIFAKFTAGGPFTPGGSFLVAEVTG